MAKKKDNKPAKTGGLIASFEDVLKSHSKKTDIPSEDIYLESTDQYLPFSTSLRADQYLKLKRLEYWSRMSIREIIENMMELTLDKFPDANKELPESERAKLKQLKTANDYYQSRIKKDKE